MQRTGHNLPQINLADQVGKSGLGSPWSSMVSAVRSVGAGNSTCIWGMYEGIGKK